jgi:hypothetical protein
MAIPDAVKVVVESSLISFIEQRVPAHVRDSVDLHYRFHGDCVTIYEDRPSFPNRSEWVGMAVAQFRYDPEQRTWRLYCADRNARWHRYVDVEPSEDFERLLQEVHEDPAGIFWG